MAMPCSIRSLLESAGESDKAFSAWYDEFTSFLSSSGADQFNVKRRCIILICSLGPVSMHMFTEHGLACVMVKYNKCLAETQVGVPGTSE